MGGAFDETNSTRQPLPPLSLPLLPQLLLLLLQKLPPLLLYMGGPMTYQEDGRCLPPVRPRPFTPATNGYLPLKRGKGGAE